MLSRDGLDRLNLPHLIYSAESLKLLIDHTHTIHQALAELDVSDIYVEPVQPVKCVTYGDRCVLLG